MDEVKCPECRGRGYSRCDCWPGDCICGEGDRDCEHCHGEGFVWADEDWGMMEALEADGEKLRQLTGEDHGPVFAARTEGQGHE